MNRLYKRLHSTALQLPSLFANYPKPLEAECINSRVRLFFPSQKSTAIGEWEAAKSEKVLESFESNEKFHGILLVTLDYLHDFLKRNAFKDPGLQALAQHQKNGWLHVNDQRVFAPYGRIPDPEDIIGSLRVEEGVIIGDSYQRMPTHRLLSSNGLFQLSDFLHSLLVKSN